MHRINVGALGEQIVILELIKQGWDVFQPIHHNSRVDLIAVQDTRIRRLQVKTTNEIVHNALPLYLKKTHLNPKYDYTYDKSDFDVFCLTSPDHNIVCFIPAEEALEYRRTIYVGLTEDSKRYVGDYRVLK